MVISSHHRQKRGRWLWVKRLAVSIVFIGAILLGSMLFWASTLDLPDFSLFAERKVAQSTKIYDRNGVLLYDVYKDVRRTVIPFENISINIKNATVAIEDAEFYQHYGIKPTAIIRAVISNMLIKFNFSEGYTQGGSTITQQVIKNALLSPERTIARKVKEWILAVKLDASMSKEDILSLYLNESPYGGTIYGVEEMSLAIFGKHASDVTLGEAAYLAALPQAPSYYSPYGKNTTALEERKNLVLKRMRELQFITEDSYQSALQEKVTFVPREEQNIKAPHFVMYVRDLLTKTYGEEALTEAGLRVTTTLNYELQLKAETLVREYVLEHEERFNASNGALVAINPKTGEILVMVGSRDYFDDTLDGNFNITTAKRQPGSAFKPFVYGKAFEKGYTPETVVFDLPTQFSANCDAVGNPLVAGMSPDTCYMPENYDQTFRGPFTFRNALAQSINVPAIKALYLSGIKDSIDFAKRLGIQGINDPNRYGLTLVLGGGEVSLLDMTSAYGVFANDGKRNPHKAILKIENTNGDILEESVPQEDQVIEADVARQINDVLSDDAARAPAFGLNSFLTVPGKTVASKTGTTNDYRDVWIVGYTPSLAVGAWMGNNDNSPMQKKVAGFIVAPMWNAFMKEALKNKDDELFTKPDPLPQNLKPALRGIWVGGETLLIDKVSQKLATEFTPDEMKEEKVIPNIHDILHWVEKDDPRGPAPQTPWQDPQYALWEAPVTHWVKTQSLEKIFAVNLPTAYDDIHRQDNLPQVTIISPASTTPISTTEKALITLSVKATFPLKSADFFFNDTYLGSSTDQPFVFAFVPESVSQDANATNTVKVVVSDTVGNKATALSPIVLFPITEGQ